MLLPPLRIITVEEQHNLVLTYLRNRTDARPINILEAGCGSFRRFDLQGAQYKLTGVDLDKEALEARRRKHNDLHEAIVGDLRTVVLAPGTYDVIYNSYLLEHIEHACDVLDRFLAWLKPNGLLIIYIPDCDSSYGFISKYTPHWLHVCFYRYVLGQRKAGTPGNAPYRTYYDDIVSRIGIREYAQHNGLTVREECGYYKPGGIASLLMTVVHVLSLGRLASNHCDLLFIMQKCPAVDVP